MARDDVSGRRLYRRRQGRMVAGVATGLAEHLGLDVVLVRVGFVVTIALGGLGVLLYAAFWAVVPQQADEALAGRASRVPRTQVVGFAALGIAMLVLAQVIGFGPGLLWPALAAVIGGAIVWRQADDASRRRWQSRVLAGGRAGTAARYLVGVALVIAGMTAFLAAHGELATARRALLPVLVVVLGLVLVVGPWVVQALRRASDERTARIREQERVELAGRVHDSVLQTMTLVHRHADDPQQVRRLVRRSERELRGWLYGAPTAALTLRSAVTAACGEVEDSYGVGVDLVMVGEHPASPETEPFVQALREAMVNAAKHAGVGEVSVYVEVGPAELDGYVRDRGRGFDLAAVPADRYGVRHSIVDRLEREGGSADVRSSAGGTEVRMRLPLTQPAAP